MEQKQIVEDKNINSLSALWKKHPIVSVLIILFLVGAVASISDQTANVTTDTRATQSTEETGVNAIEPKDIIVTFQTVKKVDGKYRYFFDIRNNEEEAIEAEVKIELLRDNGAVSGRNTFTPNHPLEPGYGDNVYLDANSGPMPEFNLEFAVVGFRYEVTTDGQIVSSGEVDL